MWQEIKNWYHLVSAITAATWYGFPGSKLKVIGITGTDGKTTTTHLVHHILKSAGKKASLVSSVYAEIAGKTYDTGFHVTNPNEWMLQKFLRQSIEAGEEYMVLEVTSHGIDQYRIWGIDFEVGVLTNVTHEHLDYHKTYENYLKTKQKLLQLARVAVVNADDASYSKLNISSFKKTVSYGKSKSADVTPHEFSFVSPLPGEFNEYNCLAAIAACKQLGVGDSDIRKALKTFKGIKGRFEHIPTEFGFDVIIDFAHTPNAIEKVLSAIKPMVKHKLIHVFGSAAKRDYLKRPIMGEKSTKYADYIVLTEEDYRTENVHRIIDDIIQGAVKAGAVEMKQADISKAMSSKVPVVLRIPDRREAIDFAIVQLAHKGDTVVLTGKAHETSLARGKVEFPWSEHEAVQKALKKRA